jgi:hypothetical protein
MHVNTKLKCMALIKSNMHRKYVCAYIYLDIMQYVDTKKEYYDEDDV